MEKILFIILLPSLLFAQGRYVRHGKRGDTTGVTVLSVDNYVKMTTTTQARADSVGGVIYYDGENIFLYDGTNDIFVDLTGAGGNSGLGVFDVTSYGALGDTSTDNTTYIQNAINAANTQGGGIVYFPNGHYITGPLEILDGVSFWGESRDRAIIDNSEAVYSGNDTVRCTMYTTYSKGATDLAATVSADIDSGVNSITVSSMSGIAPGDYLYFSTTEKYEDCTQYYRTFLNKVADTSGTTVHFDKSFNFFMEADSIDLWEYDLVEDIHFKNLTFHIDSTQNKGLILQWFSNASVENCHFAGQDSTPAAAIDSRWGYNIRVKDCSFTTKLYSDTHSDGVLGYGNAVSMNGIIDGLVENCYVSEYVEALSASGTNSHSIGISFIENTINKSYRGLDVHEFAWHTTLKGNDIDSCYTQAMDLRSPYTTAENNFVNASGPCIIKLASGSSYELHSIKFLFNKINGDSLANGITIANPIYNSDIIGNTFDDTFYGINISTSGRFYYGTISHNTFKDIKTPYFAGYMNGLQHSVISNNRFYNCEGFRFYNQGSDSTYNNKIEHNVGYNVFNGMIRFAAYPKYNYVAHNHEFGGSGAVITGSTVNYVFFHDNYDDNTQYSKDKLSLTSTLPEDPKGGDMYYKQGASGNPDTLLIYVGSMWQKFVGTVNQP